MDNLKQLRDKTDTVIPINGGVASVKTVNHNPFEKEIIEKVGKYTGFPFLSKNAPIDGVVENGTFYWNNNPMNKTTTFEIFLSLNTVDGNRIDRMFKNLNAGDLIHFKDFAGRATTLQFQGYENVIVESQEYLSISVVGFGENTDYSYQNTDSEICMIEFISKTNDTVKLYEGGQPNPNDSEDGELEDINNFIAENLGSKLFYYSGVSSHLWKYSYEDSIWILIRSRKNVFFEGELLIFKSAGNTDKDVQETGDRVMGVLEDVWFRGIYNGGTTQLLSGYDIIDQF